MAKEEWRIEEMHETLRRAILERLRQQEQSKARRQPYQVGEYNNVTSLLPNRTLSESEREHRRRLDMPDTP